MEFTANFVLTNGCGPHLLVRTSWDSQKVALQKYSPQYFYCTLNSKCTFQYSLCYFANTQQERVTHLCTLIGMQQRKYILHMLQKVTTKMVSRVKVECEINRYNLNNKKIVSQPKKKDCKYYQLQFYFSVTIFFFFSQYKILYC